MSFRPGALRDAGMVPLSSRETAKGGTQTPQTRFAQTVRYLRPNAVTRELRGTRSPDQAFRPGYSPLVVGCNEKEKHLFVGWDAAKVWLGVKRIERWFLLNNRGVTGKIKSGVL